jgi:tRNA1(Val) A37 N6-methylase TrmN6
MVVLPIPPLIQFRGGVEAYCLTASSLLAPKGTFVVCENWLNNNRVWIGARSAGLSIETVYPVLGKVGKPPLFGVYVMRKLNNLKSKLREEEKVKDPIVVRDGDGKWTSGYAKIMEDMSIPVVEH